VRSTLGADQFSFCLWLAVFQKHGNHFDKVSLEFVKRLSLRMCAGKPGHVTHEQSRVRVPFDNSRKTLHVRIVVDFDE